MIFNSLQFLFFLPVVIIVFLLIPQKFRWILLLAASYYFYMSWKLEYVFLIMFSTLVDYFVAIKIGKSSLKSSKIKYLVISLISNLGLLFAFKYFNFFNDSFRSLFEHFSISYYIPAFNVLLPVGISFYTFQTLSYTIDVYRGKKEPEKHLGYFALFVSFFPQLVAGPIERSNRLLPQLHKRYEFNSIQFVSGLKLILWGFFKKLVIADRLAIYVNAVYNNPEHHNGNSLILATFFFTFQVYCDFSAYSDIAIGSARLVGINLMENFRRPFLATSVSELWQRWHISLTSWFKDYLYIPLGGNRVTKLRWFFNIFVVFLISGLWHGAAWTYVIFGGLQGIFLITPLVFSKLWYFFPNMKIAKNNRTLYKVINIILAFSLFSFSLSVFRALSISDAGLIIDKMVQPSGPLFYDNISTLLYGFFGILILILVELEEEFKIFNIELYNNKNIIIRNLSYVFTVIIILLIGVFEGDQFIYFQF